MADGRIGKGSRTTSREPVHAADPAHAGTPGKRTLTEAIAPVQARASGGLVQRAIVATEQPGARDEAAIHGAAARGVATAASPLPHADAIQRAFGRHDISAIQAHTGGDASATADAMGAQAYATGDHVVLGQRADLFTVAHEAAHVVQQRAGVQLQGGVGATGDTYEQHADEVASLVVQGKSAEHVLDRHAGGGPRAAASDAAVQRFPVPYHNEGSDDPTFLRNRAAVAAVATKLSGAVDRARAMSLDWRNLANHAAAHVKRWAATAKAYFENPGQAPEFIHAQFGYAIETLACAELGAQESGLTVSMQVAAGATRPDVVLFEGPNQIAWLDITSKDSARHIFGKDHSGWKTKPFVYEILYEPLNLEEVLTGTPDPVYAAVGGFMAKKNQIRYEEETKQTNLLRDQLTGLRESQGWETGYGGAQDKQNATRDTLRADPIGMQLGNNSGQATRGALAVADVYDGPFGFNRGNVKTDTTAAKTWVKNTAAPTVNARITELERSELERICNALASARAIPVVASLLDAARSAPTSELVHQAIAVKAGIDILGQLRGAALSLQGSRRDARVAELLRRVTLHELQFPDTARFQALQQWTVDALSLANECKEGRRILDAEQGPRAQPGLPPLGGNPPSGGPPPQDMEI